MIIERRRGTTPSALDKEKSVAAFTEMRRKAKADPSLTQRNQGDIKSDGTIGRGILDFLAGGPRVGNVGVVLPRLLKRRPDMGHASFSHFRRFFWDNGLRAESFL
jgi:hypothetical protein